uniref:Large ribosomal subunit protein mL50 n=2 Tax=Schistocephalus solidus TaxID=70667 RepID=A0A0X3NTN5_SCHSO
MSKLEALLLTVFKRCFSRRPYSPPTDVVSRLSSITLRCFHKDLEPAKSHTFSNNSEKYLFLSSCVREFKHPIPSSLLHEMNDIDSVLSYFSTPVKSDDTLVNMVALSDDKDALPSNLVVQVDSIRFDPNDKSFFPTTAFPGRSTIVSGIDTSKTYPSIKVSKDRRVRIEPEDLV